VVAGKIPSSALQATQSVATLQGEEIVVTVTDAGVFVNGDSQVVIPDVMATNGVVHVINKVLVPPSMRGKTLVELAIATPALSTLVTVLTLPDYAPVLSALSGDGPFTVFAPTNEAFAAAGVDVTDVAAVTAILQYHVVAGKIPSSALQATQSVATLQGEEIVVTVTDAGVFVNGDSQVTIPDVMATNGVVHVVNKVLIPPSMLAPKAASTIVELAVATPALSTLVTVLTLPDYAPVLAALSGAGPFTVFAPTNEAFAAAGVNVSDVDAVTAVLQYHVVAGAIPSSALKPTQSVATLQGEEVVVTVTPEGVFVNGDAKVVIADVIASNGVVHVIDAVLMPPSFTADADIAMVETDASGVVSVQGMTGLSVLMVACAVLLQ
jgi:transforming growth factor-beta-induced protein